MYRFKVKGGGETWKDAKEDLINEINLLGIRFVGISKDESENYLLCYEDRGKLKCTKLTFSTKGLSMPFKPCMKYLEAYINFGHNLTDNSNVILETI